ncbi:phosphoribosylglycinamide formyltransferase [Rubritalea halochordaticola]|uniref:phosphoribosylglycinamide formyltransferase 1 n=1 Tax=Rubritalea halochordaticola TaxID=714537 RepID=A0ABP9V274_9BACT
MNCSGVKVIIFAGKGRSSRLVYNALKEDCNVVKVIFEDGVSRKKMLSRRVKSLGILTVLGQLCFILWNALTKKSAEVRIQEIIDEKGLCDDRIDDDLVESVRSINDDRVLEVVEAECPDVIVVNGTRIISRKIIEGVGVPMVNTHAGITPKYRGVHGGYWALTEKDYSNCGVTVHLVDTGIDTGSVLAQARIEVQKNDNFNTYPYLQLAAAIPLLKEAISNESIGGREVVEVNLPSKLWSHPTMFQYFKYRLLAGVK